jgi:hydroxymethylpyrimidine kinase/phosphomethylpyrimidine kinase
VSEVRPHAGIVHPFRGTLGAARPDVLICAGLDPSGGAGLIADVRVVSDLCGRPVGVVTALTVHNTTAVIDTEAMGAAQIREQLEFLLSDVEVRAVKIGMIGSSEIARSISQALALSSAPVVWDPVIHPSRGDVRFVDSLFSHAVAALLPHVSLLTPNAHELGFLTGATIGNVADAVAVGSALAARISTAVLVKGGHLGGPDPKRISEGALKLAQNATPRSRESAAIVLPGQPPEESLEQPPEESIDVLCRPGGGVELLRGWRVPGGHHVHGTGCALSSAIATYLALGAELVDACRAAKSFVTTRIRDPARPGRGSAAIV